MLFRVIFEANCGIRRHSLASVNGLTGCRDIKDFFPSLYESKNQLLLAIEWKRYGDEKISRFYAGTVTSSKKQIIAAYIIYS